MEDEACFFNVNSPFCLKALFFFSWVAESSLLTTNVVLLIYLNFFALHSVSVSDLLLLFHVEQ